MKKQFFLISLVLFWTAIFSNNSDNNQVLTNEKTNLDPIYHPNSDNYFNEDELTNIIKIIKSGDDFELEYAFNRSEKKLTDLQAKFLLSILDTSINNLSKKTITDKNIAQFAGVASAIGGLIYLEKNIYLKYAKGDKNLPWYSVLPYRSMALVSKLFTPLRFASKSASNLMQILKSTINFKTKKRVGTISDKSIIEELLGNGLLKQIVTAIIVAVSSKLLIDGIYSGSSSLSSKISEISLYRSYIHKMKQTRKIIVKQKTITVY